MLSIKIVILLFALSAVEFQGVASASSLSETKKPVCNQETCRLPLCRCSSTSGPSNVAIEDTPMMIALSFNGVLTTQHAFHIKKILNPIYKNPNGCPIQSTFFVSDKGRGTTDYCLVQGLFRNHNEIGVGSPVYKCPYNPCETPGSQFIMWKEETAEAEIFEQKKNIANKAKIQKAFLKGFRLPNLDQNGNAHLKGLRKYAFTYDSSVLIKPVDIKTGLRFWPHTLDFFPNYTCPTCPNEKLLCRGDLNCTSQSLWILPMHYFNPGVNNTCPMLLNDEVAENRMDTLKCTKKKDLTQQNIYNQLMENFHRSYETNKAPFIINIETNWLDEYGSILTDAIVQFINDLTFLNTDQSKNDIYFVTLEKIVEWMQYPVPLNVIGSRWLWDCDGHDFDYDEDCDSIKRAKHMAEDLETQRGLNKTMALDLRAEDLFRNGVMTVVIVVFILSVAFTVIYDKYK